jgi:hypothetical protein
VNRDEAIEILLRHRPGTADTDDPAVVVALDLARRDPELGAWLKRNTAFQLAVCDSLRRIVPPAGLKEAILAGRPVPPKIVSLRSWVFLASAACVALMVTLGVWRMQPREDATFAGFRERMARNALRDYRMDLLTNDLVQIHAFLAGKNVQPDYQLTDGLKRLPGYGAAALRWRNRDVAMICFDLGGGKPLYLFVADADSVPGSPTTTTIEKISRLNTAGWVRDGKVYLLAGEEDEATLRGYL